MAWGSYPPSLAAEQREGERLARVSGTLHDSKMLDTAGNTTKIQARLGVNCTLLPLWSTPTTRSALHATLMPEALPRAPHGPTEFFLQMIDRQEVAVPQFLLDLGRMREQQRYISLLQATAFPHTSVMTCMKVRDAHLMPTCNKVASRACLGLSPT